MKRDEVGLMWNGLIECYWRDKRERKESGGTGVW